MTVMHGPVCEKKTYQLLRLHHIIHSVLKVMNFQLEIDPVA